MNDATYTWLRRYRNERPKLEPILQVKRNDQYAKNAFALTSDGSMLYCCEPDGLKVYNLADGSVAKSIQLTIAPLHLEIADDGSWIIAANDRQVIKVSTADNGEAARWEIPDQSINQCHISRQSGHVALLSTDQKLYHLDVNLNLVESIHDQTLLNRPIAISPKSDRILATSSRGLFRWYSGTFEGEILPPQDFDLTKSISAAANEIDHWFSEGSLISYLGPNRIASMDPRSPLLPLLVNPYAEHIHVGKHPNGSEWIVLAGFKASERRKDSLSYAISISIHGPLLWNRFLIKRNQAESS